MPKGGIFHALIRPEERVGLRAIRSESKLRKLAVSKYNKRWRSWAQHRVRQYTLNLPVSVTADTSLMDGPYLAACIQKSARLRKHDEKMWAGYTDRILEIKESLQPMEIGYIMWGYGKSGFIDPRLYTGLSQRMISCMPEMVSHSLMSIMWCLKRMNYRHTEILNNTVKTTIDSIERIRPADFMKIVNSAASLGVNDPVLINRLQEVAIPKFEEAFAQPFRNAIHPLAISFIYRDSPVTLYLLERFRRIHMTSRPQHLMHAYESAVAVRILYPEIWNNLPREVKEFYVRLSQRHISSLRKRPSCIQWDVSSILASQLALNHRNSFRWGPFHVDIGLDATDGDERRDGIMIDLPTSFYFGSNQYRSSVQLRHWLLSELGWKVRRIRWEDWVQLEQEKKIPFIEDLLKGEPSDKLANKSEADIMPYRELWKKFNQDFEQRQKRQNKAAREFDLA